MHYNQRRRAGTLDTSPRHKAKDGQTALFLRDVAFKYEGDKCLKWPYADNGYGYGQARYDGRDGYAHVFVCENAHGPRPSPAHQAAHSCGRGHLGCVTKKHLRWATPQENAMDRIVHGTDLRGEKSPGAKLSNVDVAAILASRASHSKLAVQYGVSPSGIEAIRSGKSWAWINRENAAPAEKGYLKGDNHPSSKLSEDDVVNIVKMRATKTRAQLAEAFGTTISSIDSILYGKSWAWLTGTKNGHSSTRSQKASQKQKSRTRSPRQGR